jgi:protein-tyrosine-phosphatase
MIQLPQSVLFCCDHNAVRSPMAEGLLKKLHGNRIYVQSAGVMHDLEIDGFTIAVCRELSVEMAEHKARSFQEMEAWGDQIDSYDLIVAMSPAAQRAALELTRWYSIELEYWPILDPTGIGETRDAKLDSYRQTRDQILTRLRQRFPPF